MIFRQIQLYNFLYYNETIGTGKKVLDCGAGGNMPPMLLFIENGYEACGIDLDDSQINRAKEFAGAKGISLDIRKGNMSDIEFENDSFDCAYSYNSIFHMKKEEIKKSVEEMTRVVRKRGLIYLNLLSTEDSGYGQGEEIGCGEFLQDEGNEKVIHSFYSSGESKNLFLNYEIVFYQHRIAERKFGTEYVKQAFHDFVLKI